jgi:hypothetical protein
MWDSLLPTFVTELGKNSQKGTMVFRLGEISAMFFTSDRRRCSLADELEADEVQRHGADHGYIREFLQADPQRKQMSELIAFRPNDEGKKRRIVRLAKKYRALKKK